MTDVTKSKCNIIYIVSSVNVCMIYSAPEKEVKFAFGLNMTSDIYKAECDKSWMRKGPESVYDKWKITVVICDTDIP
jgi:hypothetical protein